MVASLDLVQPPVREALLEQMAARVAEQRAALVGVPLEGRGWQQIDSSRPNGLRDLIAPIRMEDAHLGVKAGCFRGKRRDGRHYSSRGFGGWACSAPSHHRGATDPMYGGSLRRHAYRRRSQRTS